MQDDVRKDFLPLTSETRWFMTWITRTFGGLLLLVAFLLVLGLPVMMSDKLAIFSIVAMVYYPVLAFGLYRFFRYQKRLRKKVIRKIRVHPHDAKSFNGESIGELRKLLKQDHVVSVGECGLDFDRDFSPRSIQEKCYRAQLELAVEVDKPLFLHERSAFKRFNEITDEFLSQLPEAVVHCFTGTLNEAKTYLDKGFYLGFTGAISDEKRFKHLEDVIKYAPLDRMMIETDAPFMLPKNMPRMQNRRNEPSFLPYVAQTIAYLKKISISEVADETTETARNFFRL